MFRLAEKSQPTFRLAAMMWQARFAPASRQWMLGPSCWKNLSASAWLSCQAPFA
jgi:hypothetical protein